MGYFGLKIIKDSLSYKMKICDWQKIFLSFNTPFFPFISISKRKSDFLSMDYWDVNSK
jgi:hypothetical protein